MTKEQVIYYAIDRLYDEGFLCNGNRPGIPSRPLTQAMKDNILRCYESMEKRYITAKKLADAVIAASTSHK